MLAHYPFLYDEFIVDIRDWLLWEHSLSLFVAMVYSQVLSLISNGDLFAKKKRLPTDATSNHNSVRTYHRFSVLNQFVVCFSQFPRALISVVLVSIAIKNIFSLLDFTA